ncbi:hypothetical protein ACFWNR_28655 [Streptomyces virginiae]
MSRLLHLDRTLDEVDGPPWPPPSPTTSLVTKVDALLRTYEPAVRWG